MRHNLKPVNIFLLLLPFGLVVFGLAMVSTSSVHISQRLVGETDFFFWKQLKSFVIATFAFFVGLAIPYDTWKKIAVPMLGFSIFSLISVWIPGIGADFGTSRSWIVLPVFGSFQPAEFAKFALIVYLATWMSEKRYTISTFDKGFVPFGILVSSHLILLAIQPDFGSTLIFVLISASLYFVGGANIKHFLFGFSALVLAGSAVINTKTYVRNRFLAFLDPEIDPENIGYHIRQLLLAVGSGGFGGKGYGESRQKYGYLPEAHTDSIFAVIAEELGLVRSFLLVVIYLYYGITMLNTAKNANDRFGELLVIGIASWFMWQTIYNIMVNLSLAPLTGIPLPFISYGGSSLILCMFGAGVVANVSRH